MYKSKKFQSELKLASLNFWLPEKFEEKSSQKLKFDKFPKARLKYPNKNGNQSKISVIKSLL